MKRSIIDGARELVKQTLPNVDDATAEQVAGNIAAKMAKVVTVKHPGRTAAQRRVLDAIGCGEFSPWMAKATRDAMLRDGLIVQTPDKLIPLNPRQPLGMQIRIAKFEMPIPVHYAWCQYQSQCYDEEAEAMMDKAHDQR